MKGILLVLLAILIQIHAPAVRPIDLLERQAVSFASRAVPEELFEGRADFNFALFFEGDLRGNLGPAEGAENLVIEI